MSNIISILEKNRPLLSKSSLRTYNSIILNLAKRCDIKLENGNDIQENISCILKYLKDIPARLRKTTISALVVIIDTKEDKHPKLLERLRTMMSQDSKESQTEEDKQTMNEKQRENWISWDDVIEKYNKIKIDATRYMKEENPDKHKMEVIKMYILLSMFILIEPRRSKDITDFKISNIDKSKDNFMDSKNNKLIFNAYKTQRTYGTQEVSLNKELKKILNRWMVLNKTDWLIPDNKGEQSTSNKITNMFYKFFGKKVSVNMLRHSKITSLYKDIPALTEIKQRAKDMGHSVEQAMEYIKK